MTNKIQDLQRKVNVARRNGNYSVWTTIIGIIIISSIPGISPAILLVYSLTGLSLGVHFCNLKEQYLLDINNDSHNSNN